MAGMEIGEGQGHAGEIDVLVDAGVVQEVWYA